MDLAAEDRRQLDRVVRLVRDVLGSDLVGAYLFGSAVLGGLRARSDLDVLAVSRRPTTDADKRRLVETLLGLRGRRVELTLVVESELRPWRYPPRVDFQYGDWLRDGFEAGKLEPWLPRAHHDLAVLITKVLLADTPLAGPPPAAVLDPVPHRDLLRAMTVDLPPLLDDLEDDTANVVLTLARIWCTVATGEIRSKDAAAEWALARLPEEQRPVLAKARAVYTDDVPDRWDDIPRVRAHASRVAEIIRGAGVDAGRNSTWTLASRPTWDQRTPSCADGCGSSRCHLSAA